MLADSLPAEPLGKPKNTGVGSLSCFQRTFLTQELNWGLLHCRRILYQLSYQGSPRILISSRLLINFFLSLDKIPTFHQNLAPPADQTKSPDSVTISGFYFHHGITQPVLFRVSLVSDSKASVYNVRDLGSIPGLGRFPGERNGNPLQYSCLENPMDGGAWCSLLSMGSQRVGHD